ncbi:putative nuclease HARBI1 [Pleurodeles waltl]|uniref:putative nuclease HARBI1 n=1 Tax=Pleurodeles waltl TaxID=8319 RepID=UPI00370982B7
MMTPYLNPTTPAERRYNSAHRATRNVVERTFGLLKSRFWCIHKSGGAPQYCLDTTCRIVATCAILHNIGTTRGIPVEISDSDSDEDDPIPHPYSLQTGPVQQRAGKGVQTSRTTISDPN